MVKLMMLQPTQIPWSLLHIFEQLEIKWVLDWIPNSELFLVSTLIFNHQATQPRYILSYIMVLLLG